MYAAANLGDRIAADIDPIVGTTCRTKPKRCPRAMTLVFSDEELVVARAHTELFHVTRAYEELMRRYQRTLFNVCSRYLGTIEMRMMFVRK